MLLLIRPSSAQVRFQDAKMGGSLSMEHILLLLFLASATLLGLVLIVKRHNSPIELPAPEESVADAILAVSRS